MKNKRRRSRQAAEARLVLNDWEPRAKRSLYHPGYGSVSATAGGAIKFSPISWPLENFTAVPLHERRGDDFWLAANYVIKKGWC